MHATPVYVKSAADGADAPPALAVCPLHSWYQTGFLDEETKSKAVRYSSMMHHPPPSFLPSSSPSDFLHLPRGRVNGRRRCEGALAHHRPPAAAIQVVALITSLPPLM